MRIAALVVFAALFVFIGADEVDDQIAAALPEGLNLDFLDMLSGVQKPCHLTCQAKDGSTSFPTAKPGHVPSYNGCGTEKYNLHIDAPLFVDCCNTHDLCYDTCGADREACDHEFEKCLKGKCEGHPTVEKIAVNGIELPVEAFPCLQGVKLAFKAVDLFGCPAFLDAQQGSCECPEGANMTRVRNPMGGLLEVLTQSLLDTLQQTIGDYTGAPEQVKPFKKVTPEEEMERAMSEFIEGLVGVGAEKDEKVKAAQESAAKDITKHLKDFDDGIKKIDEEDAATSEELRAHRRPRAGTAAGPAKPTKLPPHAEYDPLHPYVKEVDTDEGRVKMVRRGGSMIPEDVDRDMQRHDWAKGREERKLKKNRVPGSGKMRQQRLRTTVEDEMKADL